MVNEGAVDTWRLGWYLKVLVILGGWDGTWKLGR